MFLKSIILLFLPLISLSQHTFSIVAVDSVTNEIGSAGATCIGNETGALIISDILLGIGAIHTQAEYTTVNQNAAHQQMKNGASPDEIITWLVNNDNPSEGGTVETRQYGVVELNNGSPRSAAYTGNSCATEKGHRVGPGYSIQGNILISEDVLNDMENAYLSTTGSLAQKLMAVLQAAKRPGADVRCLEEGISSASAFIRVAKPTDNNSAYGYLWLDLNVWNNDGAFEGDPIDELQKRFNQFNTNIASSVPIVFPNPTRGLLTIKTPEQEKYTVLVANSLGQALIRQEYFQNQVKINLGELTSGVYNVSVFDENNKQTLKQKVILF